jgi:hypothetical protein
LHLGRHKSSDRELINSSKSLKVGNISTAIGLFFPVDGNNATPVMVLTYSDPVSPDGDANRDSNTKLILDYYLFIT